jgi:hypothetical protein
VYIKKSGVLRIRGSINIGNRIRKYTDQTKLHFRCPGSTNNIPFGPSLEEFGLLG